MYKERFAKKLISARKKTGLSQYEVAEETGIARSTIASYETARTQPDIENLGILADFYNVSTDWLIGTKGGK